MSMIGGMGAAQFAQSLISAERAGKDQIYSNQLDSSNAKLDAYKLLERQMEKIESQLEKFDDESFQAKTTDFEDDVANVTVEDDAPVGEFDLQVEQLAKSASATVNLGSTDGTLPAVGMIEIQLSEDSKVSVDLAKFNGTMEDLRDEINNQASQMEPGIYVSLMRTGQNVELMITSDTSGSEGDFDVTLSGFDDSALNGSTIDEVNPDFPMPSRPDLGSGLTKIDPQDAKFTLNGKEFTSSSNYIEDAIDGVDIELKKAHEPGESSLISIKEDVEEIGDQIEDFVDNINDLFEQIGALTQSMGSTALDEEYDYSDKDDDEDEDKDEDKDERPTSIDEDQIGILKGDSALRNFESSLKSTLMGEFNGMLLSDIGIEIGRDGKLDVDRDKLDAALKDDSQAVTEMFKGDGSFGSKGLVDIVADKIDPFTKFDGFFDLKTDTLDKQITRVEDSMDAHDRRMEMRYETYLNQFVAMEAAINEMNAASGLFY